MVLLNSNPTPERQAAAESHTREALRLFPHNALSNIQLAQILLLKGQAQSAIALLLDALQANPYNPNAMILLARAYRSTGRSDLADSISKQADQLRQAQQQVRALAGRIRAEDHERRFPRVSPGCSRRWARRKEQSMRRTWPE